MDSKTAAIAILIGAGAALTAPVAAIAKDASDWQGLYAGASLSNVSDEGESFTFVTASLMTNPIDINGNTLSVQGGYNWAVGPVVIGVDGAVSFGTLDGDVQCVGYASAICSAEVSHIKSLQARVGYPLNDFLVYAGLGMSRADVNVSMGDLYYATSGGGTQTGTVMAIGGQYAFTKNLIGRLEVSNANFGSNSYQMSGFPYPLEMHTRLSSIRIGADWKF